MLTDFISAGQEEFPMILADLEKQLWQKDIIVEGCALLPELVMKTKKPEERVLYLVPSKEFQRETYAKRAWVKGILEQTSNPKRAWENWQTRDELYATYVKEQARAFSFPLLNIDGTLSPEDVYDWARAFID